jgi:hypothetical protein
MDLMRSALGGSLHSRTQLVLIHIREFGADLSLRAFTSFARDQSQVNRYYFRYSIAEKYPRAMVVSVSSKYP